MVAKVPSSSDIPAENRLRALRSERTRLRSGRFRPQPSGQTEPRKARQAGMGQGRCFQRRERRAFIPGCGGEWKAGRREDEREVSKQLLGSPRGRVMEGQTGSRWSQEAGVRRWEDLGSRDGAPGVRTQAMHNRGGRQREARARGTLTFARRPRRGWRGGRGDRGPADRGPWGSGREARSACGDSPGSPPRKGRPRPRRVTAWWGPGAC